MQTLAEEVTEHFYQWETLGRGTVLFDRPVLLEPIYLPYSLNEFYTQEYVDDGKVPSLFSRLYSKAKELLIQEEEVTEDEPDPPEHDHFDTSEPSILTGFRFSFVQGQEVSPRYATEFLNALAYTCHHLSFEIIATSETITIQLVGHSFDIQKAEQHLKAFFPQAIVEPIEDLLELPFSYDEENEIAVAEMSLKEEYMRPCEQSHDFTLDPLTSLFTTLEHLRGDEVAMIQVLFVGVKHPWRYDMIRSVSDGQGGSFFEGSPEMLSCTEDKVSHPLFSCILRIATQSGFIERSEALSYELAHHLTKASESPYNKLVLLPNEGYEYNQHVTNLFFRKSNRWGFFANSKELAQFIHYPNRITSSKLGFKGTSSKELPIFLKTGRYDIGLNIHQGKEQAVFLSDEMRLRHTHIIGATGTGKSTLIAHMMSEDIRTGNGCVLFDPHGDIAEEVISHIPENRISDVVFIDPSDTEYPIGFNLLHASTEAEEIVLSSDLLSAFREHATSWGDQMTAIFSNTINAFLEHESGGTLLELKRFLLEQKYRNTFLKGVSDPSVLYYFEHEYKLASRASLMPLLTRIDTFLRPKIIRYMFAQKGGLDFNTILHQRKICIIKLAQGLIGEENSYLLGTLFLTKLLQSALGRQSLPQAQRHPFYVYIDEFQNFLSPSIIHILSGARKYALGLVLAHQELSQIEDNKILGSLISNPNIRICFKLGLSDAKRLESSFSSFEAQDFQSLRIGQAIASVDGTLGDFSLSTYPPNTQGDVDTTIRQRIVEHTRTTYATAKEDVDRILSELMPIASRSETEEATEDIKTSPKTNQQESTTQAQEDDAGTIDTTEGGAEKLKFEAQKEAYLKAQTKEVGDKRHRAIQTEIKKLGQEMGFLSSIEKNIAGGKRIDVYLERPDLSIACEVSVNNLVDYELQNIEKCLPYASLIVMTSPEESHLQAIQKEARIRFDKEILKRLYFLKAEELSAFIQSHTPKHTPDETTIKGYRVKTEYSKTNPEHFKEELRRVVDKLKKKGK